MIIASTATFGAILALIVFGATQVAAHRPRPADRRARARSGRPGEVRAPLSPLGSVIAAGEEWSARTADGRPLERGTPVRVIKVDGLTLTVEPDASSSTGT